MAVLASCWLIIESILIPQGFFLKWFYLSFYINPFFLFACQIFLSLKWLQRCIFALFIYPFRIISLLISYVYRFCRFCIFDISGFFGVKEVVSNPDVADNISQDQLISLSIRSSIPSNTRKTKFLEPRMDKIEDNHEVLPDMEDWSFRLHKDFSFDDCSCSFFNSSRPSIDESYLNEYSPLFSSFNSPLMKECPLPGYTSASRVVEREAITTAIDEDESEGFYNKYSERMRWFDVLNNDRTRGLSSLMSKEVEIPISLEKIKVKDLTIPYISCTNMDKKKLLRSLQSDFELVYVAQSCLTWEALHHQYRKLKFLSFSNCFFDDDVAKDFQNFQVLLQRFLEEERYRYKGKRAWNYVQARYDSKTLLQVPKITGYLEEEKGGETVDAKGVLGAIEKCIKTFGKFMSTERNKSWWKSKTSLWTHPPMEDPADLQLLANLTTTLAEKELWLKDLQGKQRCWFKKVVKSMEESQKEAMLFTVIEMKLISRVLQMPIVSSSQLNWCQQKLNNIQFKRGRLFRTATGPLFPSS